MCEKATLSEAHFEKLYASNPDPWNFASSTYEKEKYQTTLLALPNPRYLAALEIGCSIGVLTRELAPHCDALLALDAAAAPLEEARRRCDGLPHVRFEQMTTPRQWPTGTFDLILLSEVLYYFCLEDLTRLAAEVSKSLAPRGDVVLVHWTGDTNYPLPGDEAVEQFIFAMEETTIPTRGDRYPNFRLDVLRRR
jgi:2-polyprenyl-3-methyl-5-hydroxy-6-metoxy-1,4-benzoquinol methylase